MCNHLKNFEIEEVMSAVHCRRARDGNPEDVNDYGEPEGYNEIGDIQYYIFRCLDCQREQRFDHLSVDGPEFIKHAVSVLFP